MANKKKKDGAENHKGDAFLCMHWLCKVLIKALFLSINNYQFKFSIKK